MSVNFTSEASKTEGDVKVVRGVREKGVIIQRVTGSSFSHRTSLMPGTTKSINSSFLFYSPDTETLSLVFNLTTVIVNITQILNTSLMSQYGGVPVYDSQLILLYVPQRDFYGRMVVLTPMESMRNMTGVFHADLIRHSNWKKKAYWKGTGAVWRNSKKDADAMIDIITVRNEITQAIVEIDTPYETFRRSKINCRKAGQDKNQVVCTLKTHNKDLRGNMVMSFSPITEIYFKARTPFPGYRKVTVISSAAMNQVSLSYYRNKILNFDFLAAQNSLKFPDQTKLRVTTPLQELSELEISLQGDRSNGTGNFKLGTDGRLFKGQVNRRDNSSVSLDLTSLKDKVLQHSFNFNYTNSSRVGQLCSIKYFQTNETNLFKIHSRFDPKGSDWQSVMSQVEANFNLTMMEYFVDFGVSRSRNEGEGRNKTTMWLTDTKRRIFDFDVITTSSEPTKTTVYFRKPLPITAVYKNETSQNHDVQSLKLFGNRRTIYSATLKRELKRKIDLLTGDKEILTVFNVQINSGRQPLAEIGVKMNDILNGEQRMTLGSLYYKSTLRYQENINLFYNMSVWPNLDRQMYSVGVQTLKRTLALESNLYFGLLNEEDVRNADVTFYWDKEKNPANNVSVSYARDGRAINTSVSFLKGFRVENSVLLDYINEDFSVKTVVAYSEDNRKTLTMYSALKNLHHSKNKNNGGFLGFFRGAVTPPTLGYNYSLVVGMNHPDTRLDVILFSHVAHVGNTANSGVNMQYFLDDDEYRKTISLFTEMNQAEQTLAIWAASPGRNLHLMASGETSEVLLKLPSGDLNLLILPCLLANSSTVEPTECTNVQLKQQLVSELLELVDMRENISLSLLKLIQETSQKSGLIAEDFNQHFEVAKQLRVLDINGCEEIFTSEVCETLAGFSDSVIFVTMEQMKFLYNLTNQTLHYLTVFMDMIKSNVWILVKNQMTQLGYDPSYFIDLIYEFMNMDFREMLMSYLPENFSAFGGNFIGYEQVMWFFDYLQVGDFVRDLLRVSREFIQVTVENINNFIFKHLFDLAFSLIP